MEIVSQEVFCANGHLGIVTDFRDGGNMAAFMAARKASSSSTECNLRLQLCLLL